MLGHIEATTDVAVLLDPGLHRSAAFALLLPARPGQLVLLAPAASVHRLDATGLDAIDDRVAGHVVTAFLARRMHIG